MLVTRISAKSFLRQIRIIRVISVEKIMKAAAVSRWIDAAAAVIGCLGR